MTHTNSVIIDDLHHVKINSNLLGAVRLNSTEKIIS